MAGEWSHGLFNCFDDFGICIVAYLAPCVQFGQNAEKVGEGSCFLCGLVYFVPILNIIEWVTVRGKIREQNGIDGTACNDCLTIMFCPLCALAQETMEVQNIPRLMSMSRE
ncbi:uncharacterized protein LOC127848140 [Dreissena polymorpha]|uniref:Uncharacterized protein n=1 Tax=Dreissena polymorpha TaxID=45954 RepID=A0A9D4I9V3_DREPO|nr:uncharacterized protein LOC127848140 [Dreissena polymorpha]KAH3753715.1 hypothetical protein DPMN_188358 [Dreissena polymorpha]